MFFGMLRAVHGGRYFRGLKAIENGSHSKTAFCELRC